MSPALRYLLWLAVGLIVSLTVCAAFTILIDPYYVFGTPPIAGVNARHPYANDQMIAARSHLAERMRPRTLLLGNSRVEAGFDPESPVWPKAVTPVFNGGLPGMGLDAVGRVMEASLAVGRLSNVVIAVEFLDTMSAGEFSTPVPAIRLTVPTMTRWQEQAHDWFTATLTADALADSVLTLLNQRSGSINTTQLNGSSDLGEYAEYVRGTGGAALFDHKLAEYRPRFAKYIAPDFHNPESFATFRAVQGLLDAAHASGCTPVIIIYPYHATVLDLLRAQGLWPSFEEFKRALVRVTWARYPGTRIVDFSGYTATATEVRPLAQPGLAMQWYWEPGHFRTSLGDLMIERLYGTGNNFGHELRPDTIEADLAAIRLERDTPHAEQSSRQRAASR
jgi:hypothetical protein